MVGADQAVLTGLYLTTYEETARLGTIQRETVYIPVDPNGAGNIPLWFSSGVQPKTPTLQTLLPQTSNNDNESN